MCRLLVVGLLAVAGVGCGLIRKEKQPEYHAVTGVVKFDDGSFPKGYTIRFSPAEDAKHSYSAEAEIAADGTYHIRLPEGEYRVVVLLPGTTAGMRMRIGVERFHQVRAQGPNTFSLTVAPEPQK